jgi:hypothetical protein
MDVTPQDPILTCEGLKEFCNNTDPLEAAPVLADGTRSQAAAEVFDSNSAMNIEVNKSTSGK